MAQHGAKASSSFPWSHFLFLSTFSIIIMLYIFAPIVLYLCVLSCCWSKELLLSLRFSGTRWKIYYSEPILCCLCVFWQERQRYLTPVPSCQLYSIRGYWGSRGWSGKSLAAAFCSHSFYWQLYTSVSAHWAPPFLVSHIPPATQSPVN